MLKIKWNILFKNNGKCCKKNTANKNSSVRSSKQKELTMLVPRCAMCIKKKSSFIKNQETKELLSKIEIRISLSNIPLIDSICYFQTKKQLFCFNNIWDNQLKMNEIVNENLMTGDKLMSTLHLRQPGFTYSACGSFTGYSENI